MQKVLQWTKSIPQYQAEYKNIKIEHPSKCHKCGCMKFYKWGKYERNVIDEDVEYLIPIQRVCCVKCNKTYSYLPSFCISGVCYSTDFIMAFLNALILKIGFEFRDVKRRAYIFLSRFVRLESLWITFLRGRGFGDFPTEKKERTVKIYTALQELHESKNLIAGFFQETGQHFMREK